MSGNKSTRVNDLSSDQVSIKQALLYGQQTLQQQDAAFEAQILLAQCLQKDRAFLITWPEYLLNPDQWQLYRDWIAQRAQGKPIAYILGYREFWSMKLMVSAATLIPRPETEHLVEQALEKIPSEKSRLIADLGCGSGAIALAIAKERPNSHIIATDISTEALQIARKNALALNITNVYFVRTHWLEAFTSNCFDLIVSNPPYIEANDPHLQQGDLRYEPIMALRSGANGLEDIQNITRQSITHLKPQAWLMFEHGYKQGRAVQQLLTEFGFHHVTCMTDFSQQERITMGQILGNP